MKVCTSGYYKRSGRNVLNCGKCEKCARTITGLALAGVDPALCGFDMDLFEFPKLKKRLQKDSPSWSDEHPIHWRDLQRYSEDRPEVDLYGSKEFFEWFSSYKFRKSIGSRIINFAFPQNSKRRQMIRSVRRPS